MTLGLGLVPIALHDVLERLRLVGHLGHHVDGAHDGLVEVAVPQQFRVVHHHVLQARPHGPHEILVLYLQALTQVT